MSLTLIGYTLKDVAPCPDWLKAPGVREICSVASCISPGAESRVEPRDAHRLNSWGLFDRPEDVLRVVSRGVTGAWLEFAYELSPVRYVQGVREDLEVGVTAQPPDTDFEPLGYDVVSRGRSDFFECSPLSCNAWAEDVGANPFCLVDDPDKAHRLAAAAEASGCEPGDYHVIRVWRRPRGDVGDDSAEHGGATRP